MERRCVLFTAYIRGNAREAYTPREGDFVLCADGGYAHALAVGIKPDIVIGDGDSLSNANVPSELMLRVPVEKDDTDTMLCIRYAIKEGFTECVIVGGIGGRLDHTIANLQTLAFAYGHGMRATLCDAQNTVLLLGPGELALPRREGFTLSLISYTARCEGVTIHGVHYPLRDALLTQTFPLGVSNAFEAEHAHISLRKGLLLIVMSKLEEQS